MERCKPVRKRIHAYPIERIIMPTLVSSSGDAAENAQEPGIRYGRPLALLASLFFMWGFITVINNTLLPHLRSVFELDYTQTTLIESVWFIAYAVASIPSAFLDRKSKRL